MLSPAAHQGKCVLRLTWESVGLTPRAAKPMFFSPRSQAARLGKWKKQNGVIPMTQAWQSLALSHQVALVCVLQGVCLQTQGAASCLGIQGVMPFLNHSCLGTLPQMLQMQGKAR